MNADWSPNLSAFSGSARVRALCLDAARWRTAPVGLRQRVPGPCFRQLASPAASMAARCWARVKMAPKP